MGATNPFEDALRRIGIAEQSDDLEAYRDAAVRSTKAIKALLDNPEFWQRLKKAEPPGPPGHDVDWESVGELLGDKLAHAMIRVGYQSPPPPPANELVKAPKDLAKELARPNLPAASREDLVGACRTWLVRLHNRLYSLTTPTTDEVAVSQATTPDVSSILRSSRPALLGMVVVDEVSSLQGDVTLRLHGTDASMNLVVRWMTCLESTSEQPADHVEGSP